MDIPKTVLEIFDKVKLDKDQATYKVYAKATYYPDFTKVYIPNIPYLKQEEDLEQRTRVFSTREPKVRQEKPEDVEHSLRRSQSYIRDYELCNKFELFVTFTFKDGRQDVDLCKSKMGNWLKSQQKRNGKFEYLVVPEFHKDGVSLHFHALIKGYTGKLKEAINPHTGQVLQQKGRTIYTLPGYRSGFSNAVRIEDSPESRSKVGSYIRKYITKDMPRLFGKNRYWASHGLHLPPTEDNPPTFYLNIPAYAEVVGEHGVTRFFRRSSQTIQQGGSVPKEFIGDK